MNITRVVVGLLETNCYLIEKDGHMLVIDPGDNGDKIISKIGNNIVDGIIITHYHDDHFGALDYLLEKYNVLVYDKNNLVSGKNNVGKFVFDVIYNPGHTEDSISIYFSKDKVMFVGDFIFRDSIGRCDLGGNISDMLKSIDRIKKYDKV